MKEEILNLINGVSVTLTKGRRIYKGFYKSVEVYNYMKTYLIDSL